MQRYIPVSLETKLCHFLASEEDKRKWWGEGEWVKEPDLAIFYHKTIKCVIRRIIVREMSNHIFGGHLCGYCEVPKDHTYWGLDYDQIPIEVHGGLTFSDFIDNEWLIGFDCGHSFDLLPSIEQMRDRYRDEGLEELKKQFPNSPIWESTYRTFQFVEDECRKIAEQLILVSYNHETESQNCVNAAPMSLADKRDEKDQSQEYNYPQ